jgi:hypothetical protein
MRKVWNNAKLSLSENLSWITRNLQERIHRITCDCTIHVTNWLKKNISMLILEMKTGECGRYKHKIKKEGPMKSLLSWECAIAESLETTAVKLSACHCRRRALTRHWWSEGRTGFSDNWIAWVPYDLPVPRTLRGSSAEDGTTRCIQVQKRALLGPRELLTPCYSTRCRFTTDLWVASPVGDSTAAPAGKVRIHGIHCAVAGGS